MSYDQNTPRATETPAQSQPLIAGNFLQIATSYNTDHVALTSGSNVGQHKQVTFSNVLAADPNQVAPIASLYTKAISGNSQLFFQNGALAANVAQLTGNAVLTGSEYTVVTPWGLIFKYGLGTASNAGIVNNFAVPFPNGSLGVLLTPRFAGALSTGINSITASQFTAYLQAGPGTQNVYYFAWGT